MITLYNQLMRLRYYNEQMEEDDGLLGFGSNGIEQRWIILAAISECSKANKQVTACEFKGLVCVWLQTDVVYWVS
jgi:hypothetical protein